MSEFIQLLVSISGENLMTLVYVLLGLMMGCAGSLLFYLGAGRVPPPVERIFCVWVRAGYDPKWIIVAMWVSFAVMALMVFLIVGIPLYEAIVDLGTPRP